jgi:hypothetical protein
MVLRESVKSDDALIDLVKYLVAKESAPAAAPAAAAKKP